MNKNQDKGFTLVELLIVIVILGILATVTVFAVRGITDKGQENACDVEARTLDTAIESFYAQNQFDPTQVEVAAADNAATTFDETDPAFALVPTYVKSVPDTTKWVFVAPGQAVPSGVGPDGIAGNTDDRAAVTAANNTSAGFYSLDSGACKGV